AAGLVILLVMVTARVLTPALRESRLADFEDIEEGRPPMTAQVRSYARNLRREARRGYAVATAVAISLWALSAVPPADHTRHRRQRQRHDRPVRASAAHWRRSPWACSAPSGSAGPSPRPPRSCRTRTPPPPRSV